LRSECFRLITRLPLDERIIASIAEDLRRVVAAYAQLTQVKATKKLPCAFSNGEFMIGYELGIWYVASLDTRGAIRIDLWKVWQCIHAGLAQQYDLKSSL
jgi:hypothetical protein